MQSRCIMKPIIAVPAVAALVYRAWSKKSLTPAGIAAATATAIAHAYHPWNLPFVLLVVFFLAGTRVTHVSQRTRRSSPAAKEAEKRKKETKANDKIRSKKMLKLRLR